MLGVIFKAMEGFIRYKIGVGKEHTLYQGIPLTPELVQSEKVYPDNWFLKVFNNACEITKHDPKKLEYDFGRYTLKLLYKEYPGIFNRNKNVKEFLLNVPEIHKMFPTLKPGDKWVYVIPNNDNTLTIKYVSPNKLNNFLLGIIDESFRIYKELGKIEIIENNKEDNSFTIKVHFS